MDPGFARLGIDNINDKMFWISHASTVLDTEAIKLYTNGQKY